MSFLKKLVSRAKSLEGIVSRSFTAEVDGCTFKTPETTAEMSDLRQIAAAVTGAPTKVKVGKDAPKVTDTYGAKIGVASVTYTGAALAADLLAHCDEIDSVRAPTERQAARLKGNGKAVEPLPTA